MKKIEEEFLTLKKRLKKLENLHLSYDYVKISLLSPKKIRRWSQRFIPNGYMYGEVLNAETMHFRTNIPHDEGLFCQKIFGPIESWKCQCGQYQGFVMNKICSNCHVEVTDARVRRYRMGYIDLIIPVTHIWYLKGTPSYIHLLISYYYYRHAKRIQSKELKREEEEIRQGVSKKDRTPKTQFPGFSFKELEEIVYLRRGNQFTLEPDHFLYCFLYSQDDVANNELNPYLAWKVPRTDIFNRQSKIKMFHYYGYDARTRFGADLIQTALDNIPLKFAIADLRNDFDTKEFLFFGYRKPEKQLLKMVRILESFLATKTNPSTMVLTTLSVLPPNLRPLTELESGHLVSADLNDIYRLLISRNDRLFRMLYMLEAPNLVTAQSRKLLQEVVDSLIDNGRVAKNKQMTLNNVTLKGLTEILEGKPGRFRQTLLGKRVDYSGRSVIIVGPSLRLNQCGLPYEMGIELFYPFLMNEILQLKEKENGTKIYFKLARTILERNKPFVWTLLKKIVKKHTILLNRAPTLHRFGVQAFDPVIVLDQAIQLHPLVCTGFNADFDGDQMAVHLPLSNASQLEAKTMMRPSYHVLSPSNGDVILKPTQDMVMGCYYLTLMIYKQKEIVRKWFSNENQALQAFYQKKITLQTPLLVRYSISSFFLELQGKTILLRGNEFELDFTKRSVSLLKCYCLNEQRKTYAFITDIGIFSAIQRDSCEFEITELFLETSVGRLIFSLNYKNSLQKKK